MLSVLQPQYGAVTASLQLIRAGILELLHTSWTPRTQPLNNKGETPCKRERVCPQQSAAIISAGNLGVCIS